MSLSLGHAAEDVWRDVLSDGETLLWAETPSMGRFERIVTSRWFIGGMGVATTVVVLVTRPLLSPSRPSLPWWAVVFVAMLVALAFAVFALRAYAPAKSTTRFAITDRRAIILKIDPPRRFRWVTLAPDVPLALRQDALIVGFEMPRRSRDDALMEAAGGPVPCLTFDGLVDPASVLRVAQTARAKT